MVLSSAPWRQMRSGSGSCRKLSFYERTNDMSRIISVAFCMSCLLAAVVFESPAKASERKPNVVVILAEWVKRRLEGVPATASPLSRWGRFPIFTGVRLSRSGRPPVRCLVPVSHVRVGGGSWMRSHHNDVLMVVAVKDSIRNSPSFLSNVPSRIRNWSVDHFRLNFMQRTRVRIHLSSFW